MKGRNHSRQIGRAFRQGGLAGLVLPMALALSGPALAAPSSSLVADLRAAKTMDTSGNPQAALEKIDALLARARTARGVPELDLLYAEAVRAAALFWLDRPEEALAIFRKVDEALVRGKYPMSSDWGELINNTGSVLSNMGRLDEALPYKRRALDIAESLTGPDSIEYAGALYGTALIEFRMGKLLEAYPKVRNALRIARAHAEKTGQGLEYPAIYGLSLASLQIQSGDTASALDTAREAAIWAETRLGENHRVTMATLNSLGTALNDSGLYAQAIPVLRRTLDLRARVYAEDHPDMAFSFNALGFALDNAGLKEEAAPFYERGAAIFEKAGGQTQPTAVAVSLGQLARIAHWRGQHDEALALREKALRLGRERSPSPEHPDILTAEINLAGELIRVRRLEEARGLLDHANAAFARRAVAGNARRLSGQVIAARLMQESGDVAGALALVREVIAPARARLLDRATPRGELSRLAEQYHPLFVEATRIAIGAGDADMAFEMLQLANMGDLQSAFSGISARDAAGNPEAEAAVERYRALAVDGTRLRRALNQAVGSGNTARAEALDREIAETDAALRAEDARLARLIPGYAALTAVEPASLAQARAGLGKGQALLVYGLDDSGLVVFAATAKDTAMTRVAVAPRRVLDLQQRLRRSIEDGVLTNGASAFDRQAAWELYQVLFPAEVARLVRNSRDLRVLASGALAALPFAALVTEKPQGADDDAIALRQTKWLALRHALTTPIAARPLATASRRATAANFAGIGAPVLGEAASGPAARLATRSAARLRSGERGVEALRELAGLPGAEGELTRMAAFFPGQRKLLLGAEATESAVKALPLAEADVIAFATHGLVGGAFRDVIEPALVLTPPEKPGEADDGLLTASEIAKLRLDADWVILSACDTSAGEGENAPTFSGLARAFVTAGARGLLLSHWPVRDDAATAMTLATVDASRQGVARAEALRRAQVAVLRDARITGGAHPATWAPFVLVGD